MNPYLWALLLHSLSLIGFALIGGWAFEVAWRPGQARATRRRWLATGVIGLLLCLHQGYALELAISTGLFDLRSALFQLPIAGLGLWLMRQMLVHRAG